jgi:spermidine synthase
MIITEVKTPFNDLVVYDEYQNTTGRTVRFLSTREGYAQSGMYLDDPYELVFEYTKRFSLIEHFNPLFESVALIGAGGYSYPKYFLKHYHDKRMDVVEIDSKTTEIACAYFFFEPTDRMTIHHENGREFLRASTKKYDCLLIDAFFGDEHIPTELTTLKAVEDMSRVISEKGVVIVNTISALEGPKSSFIQSEYRTYREIFPTVLLFSVKPTPPASLQNIMLVALKTTSYSLQSPNREYQEYLSRIITLPETDTSLLTDS